MVKVKMNKTYDKIVEALKKLSVYGYSSEEYTERKKEVMIQAIFEKTPRQKNMVKQIEYIVTNGLGYNKNKPVSQVLGNPSDLENISQRYDTPESLKIHLGMLEERIKPNKERRALIERYKQLSESMYRF